MKGEKKKANNARPGRGSPGRLPVSAASLRGAQPRADVPRQPRPPSGRLHRPQPPPPEHWTRCSPGPSQDITTDVGIGAGPREGRGQKLQGAGAGGKREGLPPALGWRTPAGLVCFWRSHPSYPQMFIRWFQSPDWTLDPAALCKFVLCVKEKKKKDS